MPVSRKSKRKTILHEQWIEVRRVDGKTVTTFYPPNHELEESRLKMNPKPSLIYRRVNFVHGVPPEYHWTDPSPEVEKLGGLFLQRATPGDWLKVMEAERKLQNKIMVPTYKFVPRPEEFGPCPCDRCSTLREDKTREQRP